jgi:hypothetical protein
MIYANTPTHYAEWKTGQPYYIKCQDKYGNQPLPDECSMTIRPYELPAE